MYSAMYFDKMGTCDSSRRAARFVEQFIILSNKTN